MAFVSRIGILSIRLCSESTLFKISYFQLQHCCSYQLSSNLGTKHHLFHFNRRHLSSSDGHKQSETSIKENQSQGARLKQAVRDYGATIIVFHVVISLTSLGICYLAVSNGVDAVSILKKVGFSELVVSSKVAIGGSTFVMAYAMHKLFAPARIAVTLSAAPFIVRYLRRINLLKPPKQKT